MSNSLVSIGVVAVLAILASLLGREEECCEDECETVKTAKDRIVETLTEKYGLSESEAIDVANKLMSGNTDLATQAAKRISEIGAYNDIIDILAGTTTQKID